MGSPLGAVAVAGIVCVIALAGAGGTTVLETPLLACPCWLFGLFVGFVMPLLGGSCCAPASLLANDEHFVSVLWNGRGYRFIQRKNKEWKLSECRP